MLANDGLSIVGTTSLGAGGATVGNSLCNLNGAQSSAVDTPAGLLVRYNLSFTAAFNGIKSMWSLAEDWSYNLSSWVKSGLYYIVAAP